MVVKNGALELCCTREIQNTRGCLHSFLAKYQMQDRNGTSFHHRARLDLVFTTAAPSSPLRVTSVSKMRCKFPIAVKGRGGEIHHLRCQVTPHQWRYIVTHYLQEWEHKPTARTPTAYIATLKTEVSDYDWPFWIRCTGSVWVARHKTTIPRHLIETKCTVLLSTGSACLWSHEVTHREKAATFEVRPKAKKTHNLPSSTYRKQQKLP